MPLLKEDFDHQLVALPEVYDPELVLELLTVLTGSVSVKANRFISYELLALLRLVRLNPPHLFNSADDLRLHRREQPESISTSTEPWWVSTTQAGLRVLGTERHPLVRVLRQHFHRNHRIWNYVHVHRAGEGY